jgi:vacuolar protein sorting-associated protein 16
MMDESARLLTFQQQLEKEADGKVSFFGLSINETIRTCLINGLSKRADKFKSDFKVPDKRYVPFIIKYHS